MSKVDMIFLLRVGDPGKVAVADEALYQAKSHARTSQSSPAALDGPGVLGVK
jgi:hypothetical protein